MRQLEEVKQKRRDNGQAEETAEQARAIMATPKVKKVDKDMGGDDIDVYLTKKVIFGRLNSNSILGTFRKNASSTC